MAPQRPSLSGDLLPFPAFVRPGPRLQSPALGGPLWRPAEEGPNRHRTGDLLLAKQALSHLSYGPAAPEFIGRFAAFPGIRPSGATPSITGVRRPALAPSGGGTEPASNR